MKKKATLSNTEKQDIVNALLQKPFLQKSPSGAALLNYLVDKTLIGEDLKEATINVEFFGEKRSSDKSTARVRVAIYNLRKKLDQYYTEEGKKDTYRVHITKGQYGILFKRQTKGNTEKLNYMNLLLGGLLLSTLIILFIELKPTKAPKIWDDFFSNTQPTVLFIGDAFGFYGPVISGGNGWIRDYTINNETQLYNLLEENPALKDKINPGKYSYLTSMGVTATKAFSKLFFTYHADFTISYATQSTISQVKSQNCIYAGPIKTQDLFIHFFNQSNPNFTLNKEALVYTNPDSGQDSVFNINTPGIQREFAIVSRIKGPNNTEQFLFFSDHNIGVSATVEYFANLDSITSFSNKFLDTSTYFTAVFETTGVERTNLSLHPIFVIEN